MTKYLFLLGFFAFSFLSTPVAAEVHTGIVYENFNYEAVSCSRAGMMKQLRGDVEPEGCKKGGFASFIFFAEEEGKSVDGFKFVHSFISDVEGAWRGAYLKIREGVRIEDCSNAPSYKNNEEWMLDCDTNKATYRSYKDRIATKETDLFGSNLNKEIDLFGSNLNRAPDSIKQ